MGDWLLEFLDQLPPELHSFLLFDHQNLGYCEHWQNSLLEISREQELEEPKNGYLSLHFETVFL